MYDEKVSEILLIDKPKGITSFDVIRKLRKKLGIKKMGHAGTLDPLATGLLIIGVGKGTKKLNQFLKLPKVYEVEILLGKKTTTGDQEGEILEEKPVHDLPSDKIEKVLESIQGKITLPVPAYSAIKKKGKPLYKMARRGEKVEVPEKEMEVVWVRLKDHHKEGDGYILELEMEVKSGTYVRSIAEEIGIKLGYPAMVWELKRTKIGSFRVEDAKAI
ncbi:tRNA pseudouridine(55) synthase TruB [Patescibacteria group bacterium]|nr:MAG: tRNA pseudouridine(55) synthase TruB [Patescibacteria group bacterium]